MPSTEYTPPPSGEIALRQNEPDALRLLIAQRRLYRRAKTWQGVRWIGLLVLGIGAPFVSLLVPQAAVAIGATTGAWLFVGRTLLSWLEARTMVRAACVQEEFDQQLFAMPQTIQRSELPEPEELALLSGPRDADRARRRQREPP